jgi:phosphonate transport system permease protein
VRRSRETRASLLFLAIAGACLAVADLQITTVDPWRELGRMVLGLLAPRWSGIENLGEAVALTLAFAFMGVGLGAALGFVLSPFFRSRPVRWLCAFARSIHEIFWALIFLQVMGPSVPTGILAIAIPYTGIFAKVFAEILEEADERPARTLPRGVDRLSLFFYARLPDSWVHFRAYALYRLECGIRSSAVLGFVGLPTLGFHLESYFKQGHYAEAAALMLIFFAVIGSLRFWVKQRLVPVYIALAIVALGVLGGETRFELANVVRFLTHDVVPQPLRAGALGDLATWGALAGWTWNLLAGQALAGLFATVVLSQIALALTGAAALALFPLISRQFFGVAGRALGHVVLVALRSTPEYVLAYVFLQLWGPSMMPAILALALHNGAIIGNLVGRQADTVALRPDAAAGLDRYLYEIVPRLYGQFLAFLLYRWEIMFRETAIMGILGIQTLGFYVDSAIAELRMDRALFLLVFTGLCTVVLDGISRAVRSRLRLSVLPASAGGVPPDDEAKLAALRVGAVRS